MPIPEAQLESWSHQGATAGSKTTYASIKTALEDTKALYNGKSFEVFLQGSYGNDTNIYAESDVDVVIRLDSIVRSKVKDLPAEQQAAYHKAFSKADYTFAEFKKGVITRLKTSFGEANVNPGNKAVKIKPSGTRRSADVVPCYQYRLYTRYIDEIDNYFIPGIIFQSGTGGEIINYPKLHSDNATTKHQATGKNFKPLVRIFKNMRSKLVDDGVLGESVAPSYFIEGLLYNVPNDKFTGTYGNMVYNVLKWLQDTTDRSKFLCVNERYLLFFENNPMCWTPANGNQFINAVINCWNNWR
jgi:hypothetical protein